METLDLRKQYKHFYTPSAKKVELVDVPPLQFVMVDGLVPDGVGPGDSAEFKDAVAAIYGISYTLKFMFKKRAVDPVDYPVMYLEGLWMTVSGNFRPVGREAMTFTVMIMQPEIVTAELFEEARAALLKKKPGPAVPLARMVTFHEGLSMQVMHIGPYATEPETVDQMDAFAAEHGYKTHGRHHEIYISDPFRAAPEKMKTVLRHPVVSRSV